MALRSSMLVPSTVTKTLVCIDEIENMEFSGSLSNPYMPDTLEFRGIIDFMNKMELFFDDIAFPQAYYSVRAFDKKTASQQNPPKAHRPGEDETVIVRYHDDSILQSRQGRLATFIVQVQFRRNASWQGAVTWNERQMNHGFKSTLELLRLMEDAVEQCTGNSMSVSWQD